MTMIKTAIAAVAIAFALSTGAMAEPAAGTATTTTTTKVKKAKAPKGPTKPRSEASMACSKDADAKNLHGKARKTFRETCMKGKPKT